MYDQRLLDRLRAQDEEALRARASAPPISSGFTSETLAQAIADAKAVRQTALLNAKIALEEAFGKRFEDMFADRLYRDGENVYERDVTTRNP